MSTATIVSRLFTFALAVVCFACLARGQSAYFNVPTSDVLPTGEAYLEADFDVDFSRFRNGGWQSYGFAGIYGVRKKMEIGLNAYLVRTMDGLEPAELQPNFKFQLYNSEDEGVSVAAGGIAYIPFKRSFVKNSMASLYIAGSKRFKGEWTPKLTAGTYQLVGAKRDGGDRRGLTFAVEQPLHSRLTMIVDWNTGKNRFGYAAAGLGFTLTKRSYLYSAYYFGNEGKGNNFLGVYYGFSL